FAPYGFRSQAFYPCYGLAESTLLSTGSNRAAGPIFQRISAESCPQHQVLPVGSDCLQQQGALQKTRLVVSSGRPLGNQHVKIVNPETCQPCSSGEIGEIWLAGDSITQGYWQQGEATDRSFAAQLAVNLEPDRANGAAIQQTQGSFLRTGDLGFMLHGELFVTGRLKEMMTLRGRNYYPQDLEFTAEQSHIAIAPHASAAFLLDPPEPLAQGQAARSQLVMLCEVKRTALRSLQVDDVIQTIRRAVSAEYGLWLDNVLLCKPGQISRTTSGKIQRYRCRDRFLAGELVGLQAARSATSQAVPQPQRAETIETWIHQWLSQRLQLELAQIPPKATLLEYGLDSLAAADFIRDLEAWSHYPLALAKLWTFDTIQSLAEYLAAEAPLQCPKNPTLEEIPSTAYRFQEFPEYSQLQQQLQAIQQLDIANPYFVSHEQRTSHVTQIEGQTLINFSAYDYLGMGIEPQVAAAAKAAIDRYGTSVSASRLASGERPLHQELEQTLATFLGVEDCLVYVSGHATNVTTIGHLLGEPDLILYDAFSHNSILQGCQLSGARALAFPHNDWQALEQLLQQQRSSYR
ncbi:MAG: aminotransferase class I/II-fold pyridoxal phosphate-dependent enzyme, partial [Cyanobacteria bacterium P01_H01_bin.121]